MNYIFSSQWLETQVGEMRGCERGEKKEEKVRRRRKKERETKKDILNLSQPHVCGQH